MNRRQQRPPLLVRFGVLCALGYIALSWTVRTELRFGTQLASLVYPFDTFSMYAQPPGRAMGHLMVRETDGSVHRVTDYDSFDCSNPVTGPAAPCGERLKIEYLHEKLIRHITQHPGSGHERVDLILRSWELQPGKAAALLPDCVISTCQVSQ